jgi:glycosyltransferase involved in cell wall biosynthesis
MAVAGGSITAQRAVVPWVTICIPTRDSEDWIGTLLAHYQARGFQPIVLLDTRSNDRTAAITRSCGARIVPIDRFTCTEAVVSVTRDCVTTPWALFMHDDEVPSDGLFALLGAAPPAAPVQSVAIPRRWAWYEPEKPLHFGFSGHWQDRASAPGSDHHWRLFRPRDVTFISAMHTDGFLIDFWARVATGAYIVHFEWVVRTREQRAAKLRRYEKYRAGYGKYFENLYLPEAQPPGIVTYIPFECDTYDTLARAYHAARARTPDGQSGFIGALRRLLGRWQAGVGAAVTDREGLKPNPARELPVWSGQADPARHVASPRQSMPR